MDYLKNFIGGDSTQSQEDGATTVTKLCERVRTSTLIDDRRGAVRALKSLSKGKFRFQVGTQGLDILADVLENDSSDLEIVSFAVSALFNIFCEEIDEDEDPGIPADIGAQFVEIFIKNESRIALLLSLLDEYDFHVRRPTVQLFTTMLANKMKAMQELILVSPQGVPKLMDLLSDSREVIRNDAILLMIALTKGHTNIQKIVAFESAFERLLEIVIEEGFSDGGVVVEDCLTLLLQLLKDNKSNQMLFVEGNYINRMSSFFNIESLTSNEIGWAAQKVANMHCMLQIVRALVSPSLPSKERVISQRKMNKSQVLGQLCTILMATGIPADVLTECINTVAELIRGFSDNQEFFASVTAPSQPPQPAIVVLLMSMVNDKQPLVLRCAVLYCFQCFLYKNDLGQSQIISTLLPTSAQVNQITAGQLLCSGLFSNDPLSTWFASTALLHTVLGKIANKESLLRVQLATSVGSPPVTLLQQCMHILERGSSHTQTKLGLLMFLITWLNNSVVVVSSFLTKPDNISYLTSQCSSHDSDESELLVQGLCALLLGLCVEHNKDDSENFTKSKLRSIIDKRIGFDVYADRLSQVSKHECYTNAAKQAYLKVKSPADIFFDHEFTQLYKSLEVKILSTVTMSDEDQVKAANNDNIVTQYKELIRDQDSELASLRKQLKLYDSNTIELDQLRQQVQQLKDQNSLLKAQINSSNSEPQTDVNETQLQLQNELENRNSQINQLNQEVTELNTKLSTVSLNSDTTSKDDLQSRLSQLTTQMSSMESENNSLKHTNTELQNKITQLESAVQSAQSNNNDKELMECKNHVSTLTTQLADLDQQLKSSQIKSTELEKKVSELESNAKSSETEMEDLLLLLETNSEKIKTLKEKLRDLGAAVSDSEDEEGEDD